MSLFRWKAQAKRSPVSFSIAADERPRPHVAFAVRCDDSRALHDHRIVRPESE
jgi:hypothetical protein